MDPLLLEALRFGVAIMAGGLVAVISSVLAFGYSRRLQNEQRKRREHALRRALLVEVTQNIGRANANALAVRGGDRRNALWIRLTRRAWDLASELDLPEPLLITLVDAYDAADELNAATAFVEAHGRPLGGGELGEYIWKRVDDGAKKATESFGGAQDELKKLEPA